MFLPLCDTCHHDVDVCTDVNPAAIYGCCVQLRSHAILIPHRDSRDTIVASSALFNIPS